MKTMRKDVCHVWAHQLQDNARYGNIYFRGDTIYSYGSHFPIARHVVTKRREKAILFTTQGYSSSTSDHKSQVRSAITPDSVVFRVDNPSATPSRADVESYTIRIEELIGEISRSRSLADDKFRRLTELIAEANLFCESFGFRNRFALPADMEAIKALATEIKAQQKKRAKAQAAKRLRQAKAAEKKLQADLIEWRAGRLTHVVGDLVRDYMRISSNNVETTKNAVVPVKHVKRVAKLIVRMVRAGQEWHRNGETVRVGEYQLDAVHADGTVIIGCHRFERSEIERVAALLGVE